MSNKSASRFSARVLKSASVLAIGTALAGCASDTVRFSDGFYTGAVPKQAVGPAQTPFPARAPQQTYQQPTYQQPTYRQPTYSSAPVYAPTNVDTTYTGSVPSAPAVSRQPLAAPTAAAPVAVAPTPVAKPVVATPKVAAPVAPKTPTIAPKAAATEGWTATGGTYVTMREGETVYNLAKRYGVPANAIMEANGIKDATSVAAGKQVIIPTYVYSRSTPVSAPDANAATRAASSNLGSRSRVALNAAPLPTFRPQGTQVASLAPAAVAAAAPKIASNAIKSGRYTVSSGDTLSGISSRTGASIAAIKRLNGLSSDGLKIGQSLLIPGLGGNPIAPVKAAVAASVDPVTTNKPKEVVSYTPPVAKTVSKGSIQKIETASNAAAPANTGVDKMRWPVQGRVISGFGSNVGGKGNDGIDISVPSGTPVKAAENGVVIYAGDGLKEFGNTVLVRHGSGLVTVYGHLSSINVSRGVDVKRGQTLGASGKTGSAKQPQLHFEVRKNTTPVNPTSYLQ